ncbi:MAG: hypothetical protein IPN70_03655 [Candidatus Moraniibacteriota bacterium]|nr:MAG: hypothetical protein IPN70_03655 [Candidatus Moranbacteria bacterium]
MLEIFDSGEDERIGDVILHLNTFKKNLVAHLKLEDEKFYPDYFNTKEENERAVEMGKQLIEEMNNIAKDVLNFLDTYTSVDSIRNAKEDFRKEFLGIMSTLNMRIETEEEDLYDMYLLS